MQTIKTKYGLDVSIFIRRNVEEDIAEVVVHAPMYKNKEWVFPHCYSASQFTDSKILNDHSFVSKMIQHYGTN